MAQAPLTFLFVHLPSQELRPRPAPPTADLSSQGPPHKAASLCSHHQLHVQPGRPPGICRLRTKEQLKGSVGFHKGWWVLVQGQLSSEQNKVLARSDPHTSGAGELEGRTIENCLPWGEGDQRGMGDCFALALFQSWVAARECHRSAAWSASYK